MRKYTIPEPGLEKLLRAEVLLGEAFPLGEVGSGYQEIVPVIGGRFEGIISGEVMNLGADWGLLYNDNINDLNTKYLFKTDDDAYISVECSGKLVMSMEEMMAAEGDAATDDEYYFRQTIKLTTGDKRYFWLNEIVAIGTSIITPEGNVCLDVYKIV